MKMADGVFRPAERVNDFAAPGIMNVLCVGGDSLRIDESPSAVG